MFKNVTIYCPKHTKNFLYIYYGMQVVGSITTDGIKPWIININEDVYLPLKFFRQLTIIMKLLNKGGA